MNPKNSIEVPPGVSTKEIVDKYYLQSEEWRTELGVMSINLCPNIISHS